MLNNLLLSLCKHPLTSNGQSWLLQTPWVWEGCGEGAGQAARAGLLRARGKEPMGAGTPQPLPTPAPPTHRARHQPAAMQQPLLLLEPRHQPFHPHWITRFQIISVYPLMLPNLPRSCCFSEVLQLNTILLLLCSPVLRAAEPLASLCRHSPTNAMVLFSTLQFGGV